MKKIISCLLIALMMLSNLAFAEEPIEVVAEAEEYTSFYDTTPTINTLDRRNPGDGVDKKDGIVFFDNAEWMTYSVTIPEDGTYSLSALVGTGKTALEKENFDAIFNPKLLI